MPEKAAFHGRVWSKLIAHAQRHGLLRGGGVLAAVSGGSDSVCLAHYLYKVAQRRPLRVRLCYVNHGLRPGAAGDEAFVRDLGAKLGLPVTVARIDVKGAARRERRSIEDAARKLRYRALAAMAKRHGCRAVATGHQLDDQAETFLLHLLRGTRLSGLAGMAACRPLAPGVELIRPLLTLTREEVTRYLDYHGLEKREDPTNKSEAFLRNWVRRRVLPLLVAKSPRVREHLALISEEVRLRLRSPATPARGSRARGRSRASPRRAPPKRAPRR